MTDDRFNSVVWFALLVSLGVFLRVPLPGDHELNISLYDFVVPSIFLWACLRREIEWPRLRDIHWPAMAVVAILAHVVFLAEPKDLVGSYRKTAKLVAVVIEVWMLIQVFRARSIELPPVSVVGAGLLVAFGFAAAEVYREGAGGSYDALQTVHASVACGLAILLCMIDYSGAGTRRWVSITVAIALPILLFVMVAKIYLVIAAVIACFLLFSQKLRSSDHTIAAASFLASMLLITAIIYFGVSYFREYPPFSYMQDIFTSLSYRLDLWAGAWSAVLSHFPAGLGAGQYGLLTGEVVSQFQFTHNTFLGLLVEFGALGILFIAGLVILIVKSVSRWPFTLGLIVLLYIAVPMLFHDVLGLRANHVLLAFGLAAAERLRLLESVAPTS